MSTRRRSNTIQQEIYNLRVKLSQSFRQYVKGRESGKYELEISNEPEKGSSIHEKQYVYTQRYLDNVNEVLKLQVSSLESQPLTYIPLPEIPVELSDLLGQFNKSKAYQEEQLEFLLACWR